MLQPVYSLPKEVRSAAPTLNREKGATAWSRAFTACWSNCWAVKGQLPS